MESIKKFEKLTINDMQNITGGMTMANAAMAMPAANSILVSNDLLIPNNLPMELEFESVKQWVNVGEPVTCWRCISSTAIIDNRIVYDPCASIFVYTVQMQELQNSKGKVFDTKPVND